MESDGKFEQVLNLAEVDNNIQLGHILELHKEELQRVREECEKRTGNYIHISEVNKQKREIQIALQKIGCDLLPIKGKKKHNMAVMRVSNGMLKSLTPKDQL